MNYEPNVTVVEVTKAACHLLSALAHNLTAYHVSENASSGLPKMV